MLVLYFTGRAMSVTLHFNFNFFTSIDESSDNGPSRERGSQIFGKPADVVRELPRTHLVKTLLSFSQTESSMIGAVI